MLNRDANITRRPDELAAYRRAAIHMFYLPGQATRDHLLHLVAINLAEMCTRAMSRPPRLWVLTAHDGVVEHSAGAPPRGRRL